jgi:hypothetical protein
VQHLALQLLHALQENKTRWQWCDSLSHNKGQVSAYKLSALAAKRKSQATIAFYNLLSFGD